MKPTLTFQDITFSNGSKLTLEPNDIVVFVGPNNAGKSRALLELQQRVQAQGTHLVITSATVQKSGTVQDVESSLTTNAKLKNEAYQGYHFSVHRTHVSLAWTQINQQPMIAPFFCTRIATETRITGSNSPNNIDLINQPPQHPIHVLQDNDEMESKLSEYFRQAFGEDLIVYRNAGNKVPLYVGEKPSPAQGEDRLSRTYYQKIINNMTPLEVQGDGMRSFTSVILEVATFDFRSIILLDEPEAFLHPPQARLLGEFIAKEKHQNCQLFIATHSLDILQGLLAGSTSNLRVVRIQREGKVNRVKELGKEDTSAIANNSLLKYSNVLQGIFHKHVFICESDSDCLFYSSLLNLESIRGNTQPDALFIHAGGKDRMRHLASALVKLDVPVSVIADLDLINDDNVLKPLFQTLGGNWEDINGSWNGVKQAIESKKKIMTSQEIAASISEVLKSIPIQNGFPADKRKEIDDIFRSLSPWTILKQTGRGYVPSGTPIEQFDKVIRNCRSVGLYILEVGEIEAFCRTIGGHGPAWVQKVLQDRALATDPELAPARQFIQELWNEAKERGKK